VTATGHKYLGATGAVKPGHEFGQARLEACQAGAP
jgi:hypothetical protein